MLKNKNLLRRKYWTQFFSSQHQELENIHCYLFFISQKKRVFLYFDDSEDSRLNYGFIMPEKVNKKDKKDKWKKVTNVLAKKKKTL